MYKSTVTYEYQSNRVMNRNAVKGRQAKLGDPPDTTRVVNVSIKFFEHIT